MSIDVIVSIKQTESEAQEIIKESLAQARKLIDEAELESKKLIQQAEKEADEEYQNIISKAEKSAYDEATVFMEKVVKECEGIKAEARGKISEAVNLILERIVKTHGYS